MPDSLNDKTPILLHPARRLELLRLGLEHFNNERYSDAQEVWHQLLLVEQGRDKRFVTALLDCARHFQSLPHAQWEPALDAGDSALKGLVLPAGHGAYRELDLTPIQNGIDYNNNLLRNTANKAILLKESFLYPKLFPR